MATVRIYKVSELLGISSQEVIGLLKREHGINLKSASSTIEEIVARQFVQRIAKERGISISDGIKFSGTSSTTTRSRRGAVSKSAATTPKATRPLPPPRLVKAKVPQVESPPEQDIVELEQKASPVTPTPPEPEPTTVQGEIKPSPATSPGLGRIIPPTIRLRVEDSDQTEPPEPEAITPKKPETEPPAEPETPPQPLARTVSPTPRTSAPHRVAVPPQAVTSGPKPLPEQPVRPTTPKRPGAPSLPYRPAGSRPHFRPAGSRRSGRRPQRPQTPAPALVAPPPITRTITLAEGTTVKDLAEKLDVKPKDVLKKLIERHLMMTINTTLATETATLIAGDFGADVEMLSFEEDILQVESEDLHPEDMVSRAPVVTVMGHVDHGKTSLLDTIRKTRVAEREAGGITQHISAYLIITDGRPVVFLDTPGHEAFTMMRARGAKVTDVVILVVAADDGVMPQTREAINHARAANVPIIVAINKIDKADANPERVKKELSELDLVPEAWGGQTVLVEVSAKNNQNLDQLIEMVLLVTDMGEFKANPKRNATGTVLEAKVDRGRGPVATIIVQDGTLNIGDTFIAGTSVGKVRALIDDRGRHIKSAPPSTPVEVLGLGGIPQPGDTFQALTDTVKARQIAVLRQTQAKEKALGRKGTRLTLESLQSQIAEGSVKELPIIIKADVQGSTEVLSDTLTKLSNEHIKILIIHSGVGAISESDVLLASASNAIIIGFSIRPDRNATDIAKREHVDIRLHSVIYKVTEEIKKAMAGLLEPTIKEVHLGRAEVRETFKAPKIGTIAGCMVTDGRITRSGEAQARLLRDSVVIFEGPVGSLRRFKDDVNEVKAGVECGIAFDRFNDIKVGDTIEAFFVEKIAATL